jgi:hypothetical protein
MSMASVPLVPPAVTWTSPGDGSAALDAVRLMGHVSQMLRTCFAAGTPLLTASGSKPIEDFRVGDLLLSASEDDPAGPIEPRRVD